MYRPDQIKVLERQFQDNPYPDFDRYEALSKDLEIPENKLKVSERINWLSYEVIGSKWICNASPLLNDVICRKPGQSRMKNKKV